MQLYTILGHNSSNYDNFNDKYSDYVDLLHVGNLLHMFLAIGSMSIHHNSIVIYDIT